MSSMILETIDERRNFLQNILDGNIKIKSGYLRYLKDTHIFDTPCDLENLLSLFDGSMEIIGKGSYGTVYKICLEPNCNNTFILKRIKMENESIYINIENPNRPENVEIEMLKRLNTLLLTNSTPNIPFYMGDFICEEDDDMGYGKSYYRYLMAERANGDLNTYIKTILLDKDEGTVAEKDAIWKSILFQIISVLYIIQLKYPNFRHNDLHSGNILYFLVSSENNFEYILNGTKFVIPNIGVRIAIWDFDFSSIAGDLDNIKVLELQNQEFGIRPEANYYTDMHKILNTLLSTLKTRQQYPNGLYIPKQVIEFLERVIPKEVRGMEDLGYVGNFSLIYDLKYISPFEVLLDPYFDEYIQNGTDQNLKILDSYNDVNINSKLTIFKTPNEYKYKFDCTNNASLVNFQYHYDKLDLYNIISNTNRSHCIDSTTYINIVDTSNFNSKYKKSIEESLLMSIKVLINTFQVTSKYSEETSLSMHISKLNINRNKIISVSLDLLSKFIEDIFLPVEYLPLITMICLDKAIFYIIHVHFINGSLINEILENFNYEDKLVYDTMIQFEKFAIVSGIETSYLEKYAQYDPKLI